MNMLMQPSSMQLADHGSDFSGASHGQSPASINDDSMWGAAGRADGAPCVAHAAAAHAAATAAAMAAAAASSLHPHLPPAPAAANTGPTPHPWPTSVPSVAAAEHLRTSAPSVPYSQYYSTVFSSGFRGVAV